MKHFHKFNQNNDLDELEIGEEFTYFNQEINMYRKGVKITDRFMVPLGLHAKTLESAQQIKRSL